MRKYKNIIIVCIITAVVLSFAFWWGGGAPGLRGLNFLDAHSSDGIENLADEDGSGHSLSDLSSESEKDGSIGEKSDNAPEALSANPDEPADGTSNVKNQTANLKTAASSENKQSSAGEYIQKSGAHINESEEINRYASEGNPVPVEPENTVISDKQLTCTLSVRCDTILKNIAWLDEEKAELVPKDGVIYAEQTVTFYEGESVFNLLVREMKRNKIHMEFENTPVYNSAYIEGIGNLYEFDCGELSGWMYRVNGWFPNYGCSRYQLKAGDRVEYIYTCDLGSDVGGNYSARNGK